MNQNLLLMTDSYKASHWLQYPEGTTKIYSYIESRGGKYPETLFFGLQYLLRILEKGINEEDVWEADAFFEVHGVPFNLDGFLYIMNEHDGKLPVEIKAIAEGSVVPAHTPLLTIENTDPSCYWLTCYLETMLLRVWYPTTVATRSWYAKKIIKTYLDQTADDSEAELPSKLHDFGARGASSHESAAIGGMAHLVNFTGSDTVEGVILANKVYKCDMAAFSIPAAEHSTITAWGKENEVEAYRNMLKQFAKPNSLMAVVSDSYDIYNAVENIWGEELRQEVVDSGATIVIRPDSGHPPEIVSKVVKILDEKFGSTENSRGYRVLDNVRVIQGDGVDLDMIHEILDKLKNEGYSASNIAFGMGGYLLQKLNRDTQKFAMKCSYAKVNGKGRDVFKEPVTDKGKVSKKGVMNNPLLETVFLNGKIVKEYTLEEIRNNADGYLK